MDDLNFPQKRASELGLDAQAIVRKMNVGVRLTPRQIDNRAATVKRVLRQGNCGAVYAQRLGHALGIEGAWLELPIDCWPESWR